MSTHAHRRRHRSGRRIDLRWLTFTIGLVIALPALLAGVHSIQRPRTADQLRAHAQELLADGKEGEAVRLLRLYIGANPSDREALKQLGILLANSEWPADHWESQKILLRFVRAGESSTEIESTLLRLHLRLGERGEALRAARQLESAPDVDSAGLRYIAEAYAVNGQSDEALAAARRATDTNPDDLLSIAYYLPLFHESRNNAEELIAEADRLIGQSHDKALAYLTCHTVLRNAGLPEANRYLEQALAEGPDNVEVLLMAAGDAWHQEPAKAEEYLERAYELAPSDERVELVYGRWLQWAGRSNEAVEIFRKGYDHDGPFRDQFAFRLAEILIESNPSEEGTANKGNPLGEYLRVVQDAPNSQPAYRFLRGRADLVARKIESAENHLLVGQRLLDQMPPLTKLVGNRDELGYKFDLALAGISYAKGDLVKAVRLAQSAQLRLPGEFTPLVTLGQLYFEQGNLERSESAWIDATSKPFAPAGAFLGLARTQLAILAERLPTQRDLTVVIETINEAKRKSPNDPNLALLEAEAFWSAGRFEEALDVLRASSQLHDRNPHILLSLIRLLISAKQFEEAESRLAYFEGRFGNQLASVVSDVSLKTAESEPKKAVQLLDRSAEMFPGPLEATRQRLIGQLAALMGDDATALEHLKAATDKSPADDLAWCVYWTEIERMPNKELADAAIVRARDADGDANIRWRWSDSIRAMSRHESHIALAANTLAEHAAILDDRHRQHWATWHVKGLQSEVNGRINEAIGHYLKAIARGPALSNVLVRTVRLLLQAGRPDDADSLIAQAHRQRLPIVEDDMLTAEVALARQQHETALNLVRAVKTAHGRRTDVAIWSAAMLHSLGQTREADEQLAALVDAEPGNMSVRLLEIAFARRTGSPADVRKLIESIRNESTYPQPSFRAARLALANGQGDLAKEYFDFAMENEQLTEDQWRTLVDFSRWQKSDEVDQIVDRARRAFPSARWLHSDLPRS